MNIDASATIKDIVAETPNAIAILRNFGISLDREEDRTLGLACHSAGVPVDDVVCSLEQGSLPQQETDIARWDDALPSNLIAHIVEKHHAYCREELGRLEQLLRTVVHTHADRHPELRRIQDVFIKMENGKIKVTSIDLFGSHETHIWRKRTLAIFPSVRHR